MSRVLCPSSENPENIFFFNFFNFSFFFFKIFSKIFFSEFSLLGQETYGGVYIPYGKSRLRGFEKIYVGRLFSGYLKLGVGGAWMTFKKAEMAKTLRNVLSMIEKNPLNHNWSDFMIWRGWHCTSFKKKLLLSHIPEYFASLTKIGLWADIRSSSRFEYQVGHQNWSQNWSLSSTLNLLKNSGLKSLTSKPTSFIFVETRK